MTTIVGAGLAGLLAAHAWPNARVIEAANGPLQMHRALLRFRGEAVSKLTGIEFRKVTVRKGIWHEGAFRTPSIALSNAYSAKCLGRIEPDRSIWNLDPAERFVAPDTFYEQLIETVGKRIEWSTPLSREMLKESEPMISTAPLPVMLQLCGIEAVDQSFARSPIVVQRFRLRNCEAYQTVYFPTDAHSMYRASITGETLIVEHACRDAASRFGDWQRDLLSAFWLYEEDLEQPAETVKQSYGKIVPLGKQVRQSLLLKLTTDFRIYSVGRFATWRNILLDDVVDDFGVVRRLMKSSHYEMLLQDR